MKLRLVSEQCQAVLGHGIVFCRAALHLPPMRVVPPRVQHGWGPAESPWALSFPGSPWLVCPPPWTPLIHLVSIDVTLEEASLGLGHDPWGLLHLDAALWFGPGLRSIRALLDVLYEKMGWGELLGLILPAQLSTAVPVGVYHLSVLG